MKERCAIRKNALHGDFLKDSSSWCAYNGKLNVFFSSTFTDTHCERNLIQQRILQDLQAVARPNKIAITLVDMRWGVKDENTATHQTWIACSNEIERCRLESSGLFFVSLQSHK